MAVGTMVDYAFVDYALQRHNMVESQVRPSDITDRRIVNAMLALPREAFCPAPVQVTAYMDLDLKVSAAAPGKPARFLTAPRVLAKMIQALEVEPGDRVLHVGSATGYTSAILAQLAGAVTALEADVTLSAAAAKALAAQGIKVLDADAAVPAPVAVADGGAPAPVVKQVTGPLAAGFAAGAPYDAIFVDGAVADVPGALLDQLRDGGRLVAIVGTGRVGRITQWRRRGSSADFRAVGDAGAPQLPGFERAAGFVF
jgi:protein-L-isoaspartate(D-aspartate) O-methyltransferase